VFKTRIKRYEFTTNLIVVALFGLTAGLMLLSAYGSTCVQFNIPHPPPPPLTYWQMFSYVPDFIAVFTITYFLTWIFAFVWGFVIYSFLTNRKWAYVSALATSVIGFVIQFIPALIADTNGFTEAFDFGSPHWASAMVNLLVFIIIAPWPRSPVKRSIQNFTSRDNKWGGNVSRQLVMMSMFFFWLAILSFIGSPWLADAHVTSTGINVWQMIEIQFVGGGVIAATGGSMLAGGLVLHLIKAPSLTRTL
jgi:hypothetical protein